MLRRLRFPHALLYYQIWKLYLIRLHYNSVRYEDPFGVCKEPEKFSIIDYIVVLYRPDILILVVITTGQDSEWVPYELWRYEIIDEKSITMNDVIMNSLCRYDIYMLWMSVMKRPQVWVTNIRTDVIIIAGDRLMVFSFFSNLSRLTHYWMAMNAISKFIIDYGSGEITIYLSTALYY